MTTSDALLLSTGSPGRQSIHHSYWKFSAAGASLSSIAGGKIQTNWRFINTNEKKSTDRQTDGQALRQCVKVSMCMANCQSVSPKVSQLHSSVAYPVVIEALSCSVRQSVSQSGGTNPGNYVRNLQTVHFHKLYGDGVCKCGSWVVFATAFTRCDLINFKCDYW